MGVQAAYEALVAKGDVSSDPAQTAAARAMDQFAARYRHFQQNVSAACRNCWLPLFLRRLVCRKPAARGLYLHGGVGRGKTMLMDLLSADLASARTRRVHFHAFMLEIHARLRAVRESGAKVDDFLDEVAAGIAAQTDLLCFDELHVNDITDAMILGPLFNHLLRRGVTVVATSNYPPDELYRDGLHRARFLPFIRLLKERMDIIHLDSGTDYRVRALEQAGVWFSPLDDASLLGFENLYTALTGGRPTPPAVLDVDGRALPVLHADAHTAWVDFDTLCRQPRGAADYLALSNAYGGFFLDNVPCMDESERNELRRFMVFIDAIYDAKRLLVVRAAADPGRLYSGQTHAFEFQRTLSRLMEMRSPVWVAEKAATQA